MPLTRKDLRTLRPGVWLNDEVINFWFAMLSDRARGEPAGEGKPSLFMNTHFYRQLHMQRQFRYDNVRKWTESRALRRSCGVENITQLSSIYIPVWQGGNHWCLAVISMQGKRLAYYDSKGGGGTGVLRRLRRYVMSEFEHKRLGTYRQGDWEHAGQCASPQQDNDDDCGVFVCAAGECLSRGGALDYEQADMPLLRRRIATQILRGCIPPEPGGGESEEKKEGARGPNEAAPKGGGKAGGTGGSTSGGAGSGKGGKAAAARAGAPAATTAAKAAQPARPRALKQLDSYNSDGLPQQRQGRPRSSAASGSAAPQPMQCGGTEIWQEEWGVAGTFGATAYTRRFPPPRPAPPQLAPSC